MEKTTVTNKTKHEIINANVNDLTLEEKVLKAAFRENPDLELPEAIKLLDELP